jgi:hypothetical protein
MRELKTEKEFEQLKKGDKITVHWNENKSSWNPMMVGIGNYEVFENRKRCNEIILYGGGNIYFNYKMLIEGTGIAERVFVLDVKEGERK